MKSLPRRATFMPEAQNKAAYTREFQKSSETPFRTPKRPLELIVTERTAQDAAGPRTRRADQAHGQDREFVARPE